MKAIETVYNGYRFRSRLEARWAVFFDAMGIKYEYEPEGFEFQDGTMYLPDFYLPEADEFFEVKGSMTGKDLHKIKMLVNESGKAVAIGYPDLTFFATQDEGVYCFEGSCEDSWLCRCNKCNHLYFLGSRGSWTCTSCGYYDGDSGFDVIMYGNHTDKWFAPEGEAKEALEKAKGARFEHGESGACKNPIEKLRENYGQEPAMIAMFKLYDQGDDFAMQFIRAKAIQMNM